MDAEKREKCQGYARVVRWGCCVMLLGPILAALGVAAIFCHIVGDYGIFVAAAVISYVVLLILGTVFIGVSTAQRRRKLGITTQDYADYCKQRSLEKKAERPSIVGDIVVAAVIVSAGYAIPPALLFSMVSTSDPSVFGSAIFRVAFVVVLVGSLVTSALWSPRILPYRDVVQGAGVRVFCRAVVYAAHAVVAFSVPICIGLLIVTPVVALMMGGAACESRMAVEDPGSPGLSRAPLDFLMGVFMALLFGLFVLCLAGLSPFAFRKVMDWHGPPLEKLSPDTSPQVREYLRARKAIAEYEGEKKARASRKRAEKAAQKHVTLEQLLKLNRSDEKRVLDLTGLGLISLLPEIGELTNLTELDLRENKLTALPPQIGKLMNLRELHLARNPLTALPPEIGKLTNLRELNLDHTDITDAGLADLKGLTGLRNLSLTGTKITDADLAHLKGLTELGTLDLGWTKITDAGLAHLKGLTGLRKLDLRSTKITDAGAASLRKALPEARITN